MKWVMVALVVTSVLLSACTVNQVSVIQGEQAITHELVGQKALVELINVERPEEYVYRLEGDRHSIISFDELKDGKILKDGTLSFERVMCECADMKVNTITVLRKMIVEKDGVEYFVQDDPKLTINTYVTRTPEQYEYLVDDEVLSFEELQPTSHISVLRPENSLEITLRGNHPSFLFFDTPFSEAILQVTSSPQAYDCVIEDEACDEQVRGVALLTRNTVHVRRGSIEVSARLHDNVPLSFYTDFEDKEELWYRLITSDGFMPPAIGWGEFSTLRWNAQTQSTESALLTKKYHLQDLAWIEIVGEQSESAAIMIAEHIEQVEVVSVGEERGVRLSDFLASVQSPSTYRYRIVARDGYSPEPFSYDDMQRGYVLFKNNETFFPHKDVGKNSIRNPERIEVVV